MPSRALWDHFLAGNHVLMFSTHTLRELVGAPEAVRNRVGSVPAEHRIVLADSQEAFELADVLVSWNFRHIVNLGRIRLFHSVNLERGYRLIEIRSPQEALEYG